MQAFQIFIGSIVTAIIGTVICLGIIVCLSLVSLIGGIILAVYRVKDVWQEAHMIEK
jgi:hypothetical protein